MSLLALAAVPGAAAAQTEFSVNGQPVDPADPVAPCHWFDYSLSPPGYRLDEDCLVETVLSLVP